MTEPTGPLLPGIPRNEAAMSLSEKMKFRSPGLTPAEQTEPGMIIVTAVEGDSALHHKICPACNKGYRAGDQVYESADQKVALHVHCVVGLALAATLREPTPADIEFDYQAQRQALLDELGISG